MKTKKHRTLYDVRRKHQREQEEQRRRDRIRKLILRLAFSKPKPTASPLICRLIHIAAAEAVGCMIVKAQSRIMTAVANRILILSKQK